MRRQEHTQKKRCKVNFMCSPLYRNGIVIIWFFALESHANCLWIGFDCTPICQCRMHFSEQLFARMLAIMTPDQRFTCKHALSKSHRSERTRQSKWIAQFGWLVFFGIIADSLIYYNSIDSQCLAVISWWFWKLKSPYLLTWNVWAVRVLCLHDTLRYNRDWNWRDDNKHISKRG